MAFVTIEDRVDRLEALFGQFMTQMAVINKAAEERNKAAEERNQVAEERNRAAEERMARFEQEMREFKDEMRLSKREMDQKWGALANKLGTIIEDILAPNIRRLAEEHFQLGQLLDFMIRRSRRHPDQPEVMSEFDTLAVGAKTVILGEAKSSPSAQSVDEFRDKVSSFFDFFPDYRGRRLIAIYGSWSIPDPLVERLTGYGIYALRMGSDTMELANASALEST
jgi:hypothetical protein